MSPTPPSNDMHHADSDDALLAAAPDPFTTQCPACQRQTSSKDAFCQHCGHELGDLVFDVLHGPSLASARKWMAIVAALYAASGIIVAAVAFTNNQVEYGIGILVVNLALAAIQMGLWMWSKRATFPAAVASLVLYLTIQVLNAVGDPSTIIKGWLIKILFIVALWRAIKAGLYVRRQQYKRTKS